MVRIMGQSNGLASDVKYESLIKGFIDDIKKNNMIELHGRFTENGRLYLNHIIGSVLKGLTKLSEFVESVTPARSSSESVKPAKSLRKSAGNKCLKFYK